jgi:hypothetical protein
LTFQKKEKQNDNVSLSYSTLFGGRSDLMRFHRMVAFGIMALLAVGCGSVVATYDPATGQKTMHRLKGEWDEFTSLTDFQVQRELRGETPNAGIKTWKEFWEWRFSALRQYEKDPQKYIDYIKQSRMQAGLSDM